MGQLSEEETNGPKQKWSLLSGWSFFHQGGLSSGDISGEIQRDSLLKKKKKVLKRSGLFHQGGLSSGGV